MSRSGIRTHTEIIIVPSSLRNAVPTPRNFVDNARTQSDEDIETPRDRGVGTEGGETPNLSFPWLSSVQRLALLNAAGTVRNAVPTPRNFVDNARTPSDEDIETPRDRGVGTEGGETPNLSFPRLSSVQGLALLNAAGTGDEGGRRGHCYSTQGRRAQPRTNLLRSAIPTLSVIVLSLVAVGLVGFVVARNRFDERDASVPTTSTAINPNDPSNSPNYEKVTLSPANAPQAVGQGTDTKWPTNHPATESPVSDELPESKGLPGSIMDLRGNYCLGVEKNEIHDNGGNLGYWPCNGNESQLFCLIQVMEGYYKIQNLASGECAAMAGPTRDDAGNLIQWTCEDNRPLLLFKLEAINEASGSYHFVNAFESPSDNFPVRGCIARKGSSNNVHVTQCSDTATSDNWKVDAQVP